MSHVNNVKMREQPRVKNKNKNKNKKTSNPERVSLYLTNREALAVLCSVIKHAGSG